MLQGCTAPQLARIHGMSTISALVRSDSGEQLEQKVAVRRMCMNRMCNVVSQEVASAAENKRIFTPLSGPLPAPQLEPASTEWALDVMAKGAGVRCVASPVIDGATRL